MIINFIHIFQQYRLDFFPNILTLVIVTLYWTTYNLKAMDF